MLLSISAIGGVDHARVLIIMKTMNSWCDISQMRKIMPLWMISLGSVVREGVTLRK